MSSEDQTAPGNNSWSKSPAPEPTPQPAPNTPSPPARKTPVWVWLLAGCGGCSFLFVPMVAAILFPVFAKAREKARQTACLSNLKLVSLGMLAYMQDYDQKLPPSANWMDNVGAFQAVDPNRGTVDPFKCPAAPAPPTGGTNYAFDSRLSQKNPFAMTTSAQQMTLLYDSTNTARNAADPGTSLPIPGRHANGNNVAFADGHAKWVRDGHLIRLTGGSGNPTTK
jgi:prepilin-type processing-associated H-X9-DG protein